MYHFFAEPSQIQDTGIVITGKDVNHIKNVLRMKIGEEIVVSNGTDGKEYRCSIEEFKEDRIICAIHAVSEADTEPGSRIYLFQGIPKADKMDTIVQKAVELGAYEVIPVAAARSVVRLDEKKAKGRVIRWQGIAEAAAKQSKRAIIPGVKEVMSMKEALAYAGNADIKLIPYELAEDIGKTKEIIENIKMGESAAVFIGPEGGFEEWEVEAAVAEGFIPITLGKRILRTETAGSTVLSWLMYHFEK